MESNRIVLQKILGHASITITMGLYVHETHEEKHGEIRKLGGIEENGVKWCKIFFEAGKGHKIKGFGASYRLRQVIFGVF